MNSTCQFPSPICQQLEATAGTAVGYAHDYPSGLVSGFHAHERAQLLYAVSGVMRVQTRQINFIVPPTAALLLPAYEAHSVTMDGPVALREILLRKDVAARLGITPKVITVSNLLRELVVSICSAPFEPDTTGRRYFLSELTVDEIARSSPLPLQSRLPADERVRKVVQALLDNPSDSRGFEAWCDFANTSPRTLARLFRNETGLTFRQWRQQARLTEALRALMAGASLTKAATIAGYDSVSAFGAAFRAQFGMTPATTWIGGSAGNPLGSPIFNVQ